MERRSKVRRIRNFSSCVIAAALLIAATGSLVACSDGVNRGFGEGLPGVVMPDELFQTQQAALTGDWAWQPEHCADSPIRASFSEDGSALFHDTDEGMVTEEHGEQSKRLEYRILASNSSGLRLALTNETRRSDAGELVEWDLILLTEDSFCWHRSDWPEGACTKPLNRCRR